MKHKSSYLIVMLVVQAVSLHAQQASHIDALRSALAEGRVCLNAEYVIAMQQTRITGRAEIEVQGDAYVVKTGETEIYCDGETIWTVDNEHKEVYLESLETYGGQATGNILITLLDSDAVEFSFTDAGRLHMMSVTLEDGSKVKADVTSYSVAEKKSVTSFRPQSDFGSEWIVTDLR